MMRFQLLITLHEILENEIDVDQQDQPPSSDATVDPPGDLAAEQPCTAAFVTNRHIHETSQTTCH
jgi:hypothetical protein